MWDILRHSVIVSPGGEDLTGISDLDLVFQDGIWRLIAATRAEAGLTLLEVDGTNGALEQTDRHLLGTLDGLPQTGLDVLSFDGDAVYFSTGRSYSPFDAHMLKALSNIGVPFDLIVTLPDWGTDKTRELVLARYPDALFYAATNRCRDIGPFVESAANHPGEKIRASAQAADQARLFPGWYDDTRIWPYLARGNTSIPAWQYLPGYVGYRGFQHPSGSENGWPRDVFHLPDALSLSRRRASFSAHTARWARRGRFLFCRNPVWVRPDTLRPLWDQARLTMQSFEPETGQNDFMTAHLLERLFGELALQNQGIIVTVCGDADVCLAALPQDHSLDELIERQYRTQAELSA